LAKGEITVLAAKPAGKLNIFTAPIKAGFFHPHLSFPALAVCSRLPKTEILIWIIFIYLVLVLKTGLFYYFGQNLLNP